MKMDKEFLLKNKFWVSLIGFAPIWLVILLVALLSSGSKAKEFRTKVESVTKQVTGIKNNDVRNENFTVVVAERKAELTKEKDKVWKEAWKGQRTLMFWPDNPRFRSKLQLETAGYFGQEIAPGERADYKEPGIYDAQLPPESLRDRLRPIDAKAGWDQLLHRASFKEKDPTNEEVWLAQEDLWVQNELLDVVKAALDSAAKFENVANFKRVDIPRAELAMLSAPPAPTGGGSTPPTLPGTAQPGVEEPKKPGLLRCGSAILTGSSTWSWSRTTRHKN